MVAEAELPAARLWLRVAAADAYAHDGIPAQDVGRVVLKTESLTVPVEQFTIRIVPISDTSGSLVLEWERFRWTAAITIR